jgi:DNA polymerase III alpha subunit
MNSERLLKTELNDRTLWFDGTSQVVPDAVPQFILAGVPVEKIVVTELNDDINQYNSLADIPISCIKIENSQFDYSWNIPVKYQQIDLPSYVYERLVERGLAGDDRYLQRVMDEMLKVNEYGLEPLFKTLIYVIETLRAEKKVWGVGRGSSCASLILHLIGVHEVDPVRFGISMSEFFHE